MNLLAISIAPIFKDYIHGGSQRIFMDIMNHFCINHHVKIFCTARTDNNTPFKINSNFEVYPILPFKEFFPFPYMTNPLNLVKIIELIKEQSKWADCIYIHADGFLLKKFLRGLKIPIITSLHDFVYPITISSAFLGEFDKLIVPSKYIYDCVAQSVGKVYSNVMNRIILINNGIDITKFFKDNSKSVQLRKRLGIKKSEKVLLFPHRPDIPKGIKEVILLLENILKIRKDIRLLFPIYIDCRCDGELQKEYILLKRELAEKGLLKKVSFFKWTLPSEMRHIYSISDLTLNVGNFVEAFGLVPLESLLCMTPVIVTNVGCLRYNLPEFGGVKKLDFGNSAELTRTCLELLDSKNIDFTKIHQYIKNNFDYGRMIEKYEKEFVTAKVKRPLEISSNSVKGGRYYTLAPWCYVSPKGIYNDYMGNLVKMPNHILHSLLFKKVYSKQEISPYLQELIQKNILVPKNA